MTREPERLRDATGPIAENASDVGRIIQRGQFGVHYECAEDIGTGEDGGKEALLLDSVHVPIIIEPEGFQIRVLYGIVEWP